MDIDSIITLLMVFFFFILPTIANQLQKRKEGKTGKKGVSDKIADKLTDFLRQIEQKGKVEPDYPATHWPGHEDDDDDDDDEEYGYYEEPARKELYQEKETEGFLKVESQPQRETLIDMVNPHEERDRKAIKPHKQRPKPGTPGTMPQFPGVYSSNPLQNAVVWAEILGKPVALRDESPTK